MGADEDAHGTPRAANSRRETKLENLRLGTGGIQNIDGAGHQQTGYLLVQLHARACKRSQGEEYRQRGAGKMAKSTCVGIGGDYDTMNRDMRQNSISE